MLAIFREFTTTVPRRIFALVSFLLLLFCFSSVLPAQTLVVEAENLTATGGTYNDGYVPYGVDTSIYGVHYVNRGDWVEYLLNVSDPGGYRIDYLISTPEDGVQIQFALNGTVLSTDNVPNNGQWDTYYTLTAANPVELLTGSYTIRLIASGTNAWQWNLDDIRLTRVRIPVSGVSLSENSLRLNRGQTHDLDAIVSPTEATNTSVSWISGNTAVATVDANGLVTAVGAGTTTIRVTTSDGGCQAQCTLQVVIPVEGVSLSETDLELNVGDAFDLNATINPTNASNPVISWNSNNNSIASIDANGHGVATGQGSTTIEVTTADGGFRAQCQVHVRVPVSSISLSDTYLTMNVGQTYHLQEQIFPLSATDTQVYWSSNATAIALVNSEGLVGAMSVGEARITATTRDGGYTAVCSIRVVRPVEGVTLSASAIDLIKGNSYHLNALIHPENATDTRVSWTSSASNVVTVDSLGQLLAVGGGIAWVTATTAEGGYSDSCRVQVTVPVTGVRLNQHQVVMYVGQNFTLQAELFPEDATNSSYSWCSREPLVARVDAYGMVTALAEGQVQILVTSSDGGFSDSCAFTIRSLQEQMAYPDGTPHRIPGSIEAVHFDLGTNGEAYYDTDSGNNGSGPRSDTDVDTEYDIAPGNLAWLETGEWLEYTVEVAEAGDYDISLLVSSIYGDGALHLEFDGQDRTGIRYIGETAASGTFDTLCLKHITLSAGLQTMRVYVDQGGFRLGTMRFEGSPVTLTGIALSDALLTLEVGVSYQLEVHLTPEEATRPAFIWISGNSESVRVDSLGRVTALAVGGSMVMVSTADGSHSASCLVEVIPAPIKLVIEAEDFIATGGTFDGFQTYSADSIVAIKDNRTGDWGDYQVEVPVSGTYSVEYFIGTTVSGAAVEFVLNDTSQMLDRVAPGNDWDQFIPMMASQQVNLYQGTQMIRLRGWGTSGWEWNLDKFILRHTGDLEVNPPATIKAMILTVFPNPAREVVTLRFSENMQGSQASVSLYNAMGNLIVTEPVANYEHQLNVEHFPEGLYFIRIEYNGRSSIGRFMKR